jgi:hypothetical protein
VILIALERIDGFQQRDLTQLELNNLICIKITVPSTVPSCQIMSFITTEVFAPFSPTFVYVWIVKHLIKKSLSILIRDIIPFPLAPIFF